MLPLSTRLFAANVAIGAAALLLMLGLERIDTPGWLLFFAALVPAALGASLVARTMARDAEARTRRHRDRLGAVADGMGRAADAAGNAGADVFALSQRTAESHDMVGAIGQIAEKTHLLSVNASIEAARAGEAGRGFGVVAEEIRRLADSSARSAERIEEIVAGIDDHAQRVVDTMQASTDALAESRDRQRALAESLVDDGNPR